jgi:hypothetical protein
VQKIAIDLLHCNTEVCNAALRLLQYLSARHAQFSSSLDKGAAQFEIAYFIGPAVAEFLQRVQALRV